MCQRLGEVASFELIHKRIIQVEYCFFVFPGRIGSDPTTAPYRAHRSVDKSTLYRIDEKISSISIRNCREYRMSTGHIFVGLAGNNSTSVSGRSSCASAETRDLLSAQVEGFQRAINSLQSASSNRWRMPPRQHDLALMFCLRIQAPRHP